MCSVRSWERIYLEEVTFDSWVTFGSGLVTVFLDLGANYTDAFSW